MPKHHTEDQPTSHPSRRENTMTSMAGAGMRRSKVNEGTDPQLHCTNATAKANIKINLVTT
jgi:hypothetical protein